MGLWYCKATSPIETQEVRSEHCTVDRCQNQPSVYPSRRGTALSEKHSGERSASAPNINVTPLIDVLLVLLINFMVIQPQREAKLPVRAPAAALPGPIAPRETLLLTVTSEFQLALNSTPLALDELLPKLTELMQQRPVDTRTLFIRAPPLLQYGPVVLLIGQAKGAGVVTVGLSADDS
jgi:biopolymer transport protein TolR